MPLVRHGSAALDGLSLSFLVSLVDERFLPRAEIQTRSLCLLDRATDTVISVEGQALTHTPGVIHALGSAKSH